MLPSTNPKVLYLKKKQKSGLFQALNFIQIFKSAVLVEFLKQCSYGYFCFLSDYPYATLCLTITLQRKLSIYLITIYLPSISLVALSWVGFWIDKRAVPARASLTITTILAQITLITGAANQLVITTAIHHNEVMNKLITS